MKKFLLFLTLISFLAFSQEFEYEYTPQSIEPPYNPYFHLDDPGDELVFWEEDYSDGSYIPQSRRSFSWLNEVASYNRIQRTMEKHKRFSESIKSNPLELYFRLKDGAKKTILAPLSPNFFKHKISIYCELHPELDCAEEITVDFDWDLYENWSRQFHHTIVKEISIDELNNLKRFNFTSSYPSKWGFNIRSFTLRWINDAEKRHTIKKVFGGGFDAVQGLFESAKAGDKFILTDIKFNIYENKKKYIEKVAGQSITVNIK
tara:strand:- start:43 stop:825 length:783 start_codon:yes stop_codon:yes gene_type:complete